MIQFANLMYISRKLNPTEVKCMLLLLWCSWVSMKRGGCKFEDSKTGAVLSQNKCCFSFAVGTQAQS